MSTPAPKAYICSPYTGDIETNIVRARAMCFIAARQGYNPFAPHLYYTQFLDDALPAQRKQGIQFGLEEIRQSERIFIADGLCSTGMAAEIKVARELGIEERHVKNSDVLQYLQHIYAIEVRAAMSQWRHESTARQTVCNYSAATTINHINMKYERIFNKLHQISVDETAKK